MEKIEKLESVRKTLKSEFIGLDSIIDEIIKTISPWYLTPEVITRPLVVSLFGMTGTGKTSLVRRLIELLELNEDSAFFDCGECREDRNIVSDIKYTFSGEDDSCSFDNQRRLVLVFDEFQYAKTLNESGEEEIKSNLRPIWEILDFGKLNLNFDMTWEYRQLVKYFKNFIPFAKLNRDIPVKGTFIEQEQDVKYVLESVGVTCFDDRQIPGIDRSDEEESTKSLNYRPLPLLSRDLISALSSALNNYEAGLGTKTLGEYFNNSFANIGEFVDWLSKFKDQAISQKFLDCSKSLIFVLGNIDEAYKINDLNPDMDADLFKNMTDKITISDIKEALRIRFRPEQISRIGNNIILYPTLSKESFERIIQKEVKTIISNFQKVCPIDITLSDNFYKLLYSEGVYPTQGVRPVFTTIGTIFTPLLSKIAIHKGNKVIFDTVEDNFRVDEVKVLLKYEKDVEEITLPLTLGKLRNPLNRKKRYIEAIHEAGHAIIYSYLTGNLPQSIIAVSTDGGGFCTTYDSDVDGEIQSKRDVDNGVKISLGGWVAEHLIFPDDLCLLGSSSDIKHAWESFCDAAYSCGYFQPISYSDKQVENNSSGISTGLSDRISVGSTKDLSTEIVEKMEQFKKEVEFIIKENIDLLQETAKYLGSEGSMGSEKFKELIKTYGKTLNMDQLEKAKEELNMGNYLNYIK